METFGVSMITNLIAADGTNATNHKEVMEILNGKKQRKNSSEFSKLFFKTKNLNCKVMIP